MIKTPKDKQKINNGYTVDIKWNESSFNANNRRLQRAIYRASKYSLDTMNEYYVPRRTGELISSSKLEKVNNESYNIIWQSDYAASVYYNTEGEIEYERGPFWFDRMITVYAKRIEEEANKAYYIK